MSAVSNVGEIRFNPTCLLRSFPLPGKFLPSCFWTSYHIAYACRRSPILDCDDNFCQECAYPLLGVRFAFQGNIALTLCEPRCRSPPPISFLQEIKQKSKLEVQTR